LFISSALFQLQAGRQSFNVKVTILFKLCRTLQKEPSSANDFLKSSSLYREFQAEREEILKHKWIESEKAGHDIGFERALTEWIIKHRPSWRKTRQSAATN